MLATRHETLCPVNPSQAAHFLAIIAPHKWQSATGEGRFCFMKSLLRSGAHNKRNNQLNSNYITTHEAGKEINREPHEPRERIPPEEMRMCFNPLFVYFAWFAVYCSLGFSPHQCNFPNAHFAI